MIHRDRAFVVGQPNCNRSLARTRSPGRSKNTDGSSRRSSSCSTCNNPKRVNARRQLNKGAALHARSTVKFAHQGKVRHCHIAEQASQALGISLVVNCIAAYNANLLTPTVNGLRAQGHTIDDENIAHLGPPMTEHLNVHGGYSFDLTNVYF